jgi:DNA-binding transcriptional MerR regulator
MRTAPHPVAAGAMTIEELGERAGITTRTIRSYQTMGMVPAPQKIGRTGYYAEAHLERLEAIGRLMQRGFSLASIAALFEAHEQGLTLGQVLGIRGPVPARSVVPPGSQQGAPPRPARPSDGAEAVIDLR